MPSSHLLLFSIQVCFFISDTIIVIISLFLPSPRMSHTMGTQPPHASCLENINIPLEKCNIQQGVCTEVRPLPQPSRKWKSRIWEIIHIWFKDPCSIIVGMSDVIKQAETQCLVNGSWCLQVYFAGKGNHVENLLVPCVSISFLVDDWWSLRPSSISDDYKQSILPLSIHQTPFWSSIHQPPTNVKDQ